MARKLLGSLRLRFPTLGLYSEVSVSALIRGFGALDFGGSMVVMVHKAPLVWSFSEATVPQKPKEETCKSKGTKISFGMEGQYW